MHSYNLPIHPIKLAKITSTGMPLCAVIAKYAMNYFESASIRFFTILISFCVKTTRPAESLISAITAICLNAMDNLMQLKDKVGFIGEILFNGATPLA